MIRIAKPESWVSLLQQPGAGVIAQRQIGAPLPSGRGSVGVVNVVVDVDVIVDGIVLVAAWPQCPVPEFSQLATLDRRRYTGLASQKNKKA